MVIIESYISNLKGKKNDSFDVNILIGYFYPKDYFHRKSVQLFQNLKNYDNFILFNTVKMSFIEHIDHIIGKAANIINLAINNVIRQFQNNNINRVENREFIDSVETKIKEILKSVRENDMEKIQDEIHRIAGEFAYTSLIDPEIRKSMLDRNQIFSREESKRKILELHNTIHQINDNMNIFSLESYCNDKIISIVDNQQTFNNDPEDRTIALDVLSFYIDETIEFDFHTADVPFSKFLKRICEDKKYVINVILVKN
jgi:hypothetical protein